MHGTCGFALGGAVVVHAHAHIAAAHVGDGRLELAAGKTVAGLALKQGDDIAGLVALHLHMAGGTCRQVQLVADVQWNRAVIARHREKFGVRDSWCHAESVARKTGAESPQGRQARAAPYAQGVVPLPHCEARRERGKPQSGSGGVFTSARRRNPPASGCLRSRRSI
ncbi:hypothetical protein SDC9_165097 [bioreactor metagenome]|uniref:Uncharacterized protein n=1 Tax=bioreactor metagenome TaxID=1076179 RepID=A0A645FVR5_9ZZZZ